MSTSRFTDKAWQEGIPRLIGCAPADIELPNWGARQAMWTGPLALGALTRGRPIS